MRARPVALLLFFLSGFAGLVFEIIFLRQLAWLFGNSAVATALVLGAFMGGLALGALLFGRLADRVGNGLALYGALEIGAALSAGALTWLLGSGRGWFVVLLQAVGSPGFQRFAEFTFAFLLVLVPTVFMGGTLPALARYWIRDFTRFAGSLGLLYALNTVGAAAGVFTTGFVLIERLGVARSAYLAAGVLAGVGALALWLARREMPEPSLRESSYQGLPGSAAPEESSASDSVRWACLAAAGWGGFAVLGYEVAWTRLLSLPMRSFSYSFSLMLSLFLLGLFLGALLLSRLARRLRPAARWLGWFQIAMGLYVAVSVFWLPSLLVPSRAGSFGGFLAASGLRAAWIVLPPTILSGMALPLAARAVARASDRIGGDVGRVYGANTAGAIGGALTAGLVLLPTIGAPTTLVVLGVVNSLAGAAVLLALGLRRVEAWTAVALALLCGLPATAGSERFVRAFLQASGGAAQIGELLYFHEGATDTVAIVEKEYGYRDAGAKSLITNGVAMSATVKPVRRYMTLEGHLPALFAHDPRSALAIGVGTGITLGAIASHPDFESIVAVELSEGVLGGLPIFEAENEGAYRDPRVRLIRGDGRHWLEMTEERFDVITLEPPPPIVAGSVHLYSFDFYELCRSRLTGGGVLAQWLPLHAQSVESARMTARTFVEAMPHAMLWLPSARDAVLIGSSRPLELDRRRLVATFAEPSVRSNLATAYVESPEALLATFLFGRAGVELWAGEVPLITDDRPHMEFFRHQGGNMKDRDIASLLDIPQEGLEWLRGTGTGAPDEQEVAAENRALRLYVRSVIEGDARLAVSAVLQSRGTEFFLFGLGCAAEQLAELRRTAQPGDGAAADHHRKCIELRDSLTGPAPLPVDPER